MEDSSLTISKKPSEFKSMQYDTLRELAIQHIQEMAGKLWTDYNSHDPGITILEVLSYAITDLGYRSRFDIKDLLAREKASDPDPGNFYTAARILPNRPLTLQDYRKLLIDVEVVDKEDEGCRYAGVKNAWLQKSDEAEEEIFVNTKDSQLSLDPVSGKGEQESYYIKTLYDVLLEFDECEKFGDLNENTIEEEFVLYEHPLDSTLEGLIFNIKIQFPVWDHSGVDWDDPVSVRSNIQSIQIDIANLPGNYSLTPVVSNLNKIILKGNKTSGGTSSAIAGITEIIDKLNNFLYHPDTGLLALYIEKVNKIFEIVAAARSRLQANRNLCEDFFRFRAVRVEEIILCADIEIAPSADVDRVEAHIFHLISRFLSPTVHFYTLEEMRNKCRRGTPFDIVEINPAKQLFTVEAADNDKLPVKDETITVFGLGASPQEFTVRCVDPNHDEVNRYEIEVAEQLLGNDLQEDAYLIRGRFEEKDCLTVDQIFEGPLLKHGFIDEEELASADRKKVIRVSDLIQIIMDVEGVVSVKEIQIANRPQNNDFDIESKSVRWCLELAFDHDYVPRLNTENSKLTYHKDDLPFHANDAEVETLIQEFGSEERGQKIRYPKQDLSVPIGQYRDPADYTSIQEDFPLVYGVGSEGIPGLAELSPGDREQRKIQVAQLKGYLLLFDQFLANYLAQVANVKHLFTMESRIGDTHIDKTYYTQPLSDVVPDGGPLYRDLNDHEETLQQITEDTQLFERRRNKFLDHLLGRFAETFADYAMLSSKISGPKAPREMIDDKLNFLGQYPELSSGRGMAINYRDKCSIWHVNNGAGLEKRGGLLLGMSPKEAEELVFRDPFIIANPSTSVYRVIIEDGSSTTVMYADQDFESEGVARAHMEQMIVTGVFKQNYEIRATDSGGFHFVLRCGDKLLGVSENRNYTSETAGGDADTAIDQLVALFKEELYGNPEANRKNLTCPLENYIDHEIRVDMSPLPDAPPTYTVSYTLYKKAFEFTEEHELLTGSVTRETEKDDPEEEVLQKAKSALHDILWDLVNHGAHRQTYRLDPESAPYSPYSFLIRNARGEDIARSVDTDFNQALADDIKALSPGTIHVHGSTANDGEYDIVSAVADGPHVTIEVDPAPPSSVFDGRLTMGESYDISFIEKESRNVILTDLDPEIYEGDTVELRDTEDNNGVFTVQTIRRSGDKIYLKLDEMISQDETEGSLRKAYNITGIETNAFVIRGGRGKQAVADSIGFIEDTFFSHEGFHVLEHLLLRPRTDQQLFVDVEEPVMDESASPAGELCFWKRLPVTEASAETNTFTVAGDISTELVGGDTLRVNGGSFNDGEYIVRDVSLQEGASVVEVESEDVQDAILFDLPANSFTAGVVSYRKQASIDSIGASEHQIIVSDPDAALLGKDSEIEIRDSQDQRNDGVYLVSEVEEAGEQVIITIYKVQKWVKDRLLPIHLDQDCETCKIKDPYSYVVSVVVPYWPGRFVNMDFRKFAEKRLRMEAPAHVMLNICWISCEHMREFEKRYKQWLVAVNSQDVGPAGISEALDGLIDILTRMRNVYPTGTLHDCEEDDTLDGAVILNNSVLGTF
ncbi:hypothetical protein [Fodinibius sediminis]|uniref:Baseplate J-like protein n=1 Tax=Fodinibius sediminis TaxID=1214077 RepID=A0A521DJ89_9BACT|nr:hypothetical protein [Fodinibius sediminis]SMO71799.1 hypothetical protein SAMN06265218_110125 [Fodinibius sediminis]